MFFFFKNFDEYASEELDEDEQDLRELKKMEDQLKSLDEVISFIVPLDTGQEV